MAVTPLSGTDPVTPTPEAGEAEFNAAVEAAEDGMTPELLDMMAAGAVTVGGQMIIMPQVNELLKEAFAEDE